MQWAPDDEAAASYTEILRALLPGWAVVWDPFALVWVAARGKDGPQVTAPAGLMRRALRAPGQDAMSEAGALDAALGARGLNAVAHERSVTAWRGQGSAVLVVAVRPAAGSSVWARRRGERQGSRPLGDVEGTADAVAAFLAGDHLEGGQT